MRVYPPLEFASVRGDGDVLGIRFKGELPETTIVLAVAGGYLDYHGVKGMRPILLRFATADSIANGAISGRVRFKGVPDSSGVVNLFAIRPDSTIDPVNDREDLVAFAGPLGEYRFEGLPADSASYLMLAFIDANGDGRRSGEKEFWEVFADTLLLTPDRPTISHLGFDIIDPNEPGGVEGSVVDETGLGVPPLVVLRPLLPEESMIAALVDTSGVFALPRIPPGRYILTALVDMRRDSLCGDYPSPEDSTILLPEPCYTAAETLLVTPGETIKLEPFVLDDGGAR